MSPIILVLPDIMQRWRAMKDFWEWLAPIQRLLWFLRLAKNAMLGSNPIAVAMPADPYPFFFDCSTTVVTRGKLEMYNKMEKPLPNGWALDKDGHASTDAPDVLANIVAKKGGGIMPLGGNEEVTGSHKGIWIWYVM